MALARLLLSFHFGAHLQADAVTGTTFSNAAFWSYGLAAVGYLLLTMRMALGWKGGARGTGAQSANRENLRLRRVRGGPGRTRTCNQAVMSRRL